ncbi:MAG: NUDIX hydrolase [Acidimicrobiales bacterium]
MTDERLGALHAWLSLRAADPVDDRESASVARFDLELARLPRPFDQDADPVHVTSSAIVTGPAGVLLLRHKRLGIWVQPGGHLEPAEDLAAAALREAGEETGLSLLHPPTGPELVHVDVHPSAAGHTHLDVRWLLHGQGTPAPPPEESQDVAWFDWASAIRVADDALVGALRRLRPRT